MPTLKLPLSVAIFQVLAHYLDSANFLPMLAGVRCTAIIDRAVHRVFLAFKHGRICECNGAGEVEKLN